MGFLDQQSIMKIDLPPPSELDDHQQDKNQMSLKSSLNAVEKEERKENDEMDEWRKKIELEDAKLEEKRLNKENNPTGCCIIS